MRVKRGMRGLIINEGHLSGLGYADMAPMGPVEASMPHGIDPNLQPWLLLGAGTLVLVGIGYLLAQA